MEIRFKNLIRGDRVIWSVLLLLSMLSLLIVYSATGALAFRQAEGNTFHFLIRQMFFLGVGFGLIVVMVKVVPVRIYSIIAKGAVLFSIGVLSFAIACKVAHLPFVSATGRTIYLGPITFQPAEIAKLSLIMYTAKILAVEQGSDDGMKKGFLKIITIASAICAMISVSNFSTAALLFATVISMMFIGRIPFRYILLVFSAGIAMIIGLYILGSKVEHLPARLETAYHRMYDFIHGVPPAEKKGITQADYAKLAIYEGGIIGKGPGNSDVANYMAAAYNDFIYAIIVEEYGLIGGLFLLSLYMIFFFRGIRIVRKADRTFPAFLVSGLVLIFVYQAFINMGVSTGVFPVTGQPLPWISLGGTSLIFTSMAFGCILSVSYQNQKNQISAATVPAVQVNLPEEDEEMK
jgi:cell division protein FtsW